MWHLLTAKNVAVFLGLATVAFCVSTIVLAIEKSNLENELEDALNKLSSTVFPSSSTQQPLTTLASNSTVTSTSTEFPWPTITVTNEPGFPTLPPGLPDPEKITFRLPNEIRPIKYKLYIHPDIKARTCKGLVSIQFEVDIITNLIVLHAKNLEINSISILNMMARMRIRIKKFYLDAKREMLFIELDETLFKMTPYVVSINYDFQMDGLAGLYASTYLDAENKDR